MDYSRQSHCFAPPSNGSECPDSEGSLKKGEEVMGSTGNLSPEVFSVNVRAYQLSQVPSEGPVLGNRKFPLGTIPHGGKTYP